MKIYIFFKTGSQLEKDRATLEKLSEAPKVDEGAKEKIAKLRKVLVQRFIFKSYVKIENFASPC